MTMQEKGWVGKKGLLRAVLACLQSVPGSC